MDENSVEQSSLTASMSRSSSLPIKTEVKPSADQLSAGNKQGSFEVFPASCRRVCTYRIMFVLRIAVDITDCNVWWRTTEEELQIGSSRSCSTLQPLARRLHGPLRQTR